jgi:hypothetical protein
MANLLELLKTYDEFRDKTTAQETPARGASDASGDAGAPVPPAPPATLPLGLPPSPDPEQPAAEIPTPPAPPVAGPSQPVPWTEAERQPAAEKSTLAEPRATPAPFPPAAFPPPVAAPAVGPAAPTVAPTPQPTGDAATDSEPEALYRQALLSVSRMFEAAVMENITPGRLLATIGELEELAPLVVDSTARGRGLLRKAMGTYAEGEGFVLPHSVNVAILAVQLGRELEFESPSLLNLCMAGFTHDIGSVRLPQGLLTKSESLTPTEWDEMRSRPTHSYETLRNLGERYEHVAEIAHQVYERLDGSGYPKGLQGDEILPEARILGTVDFFESFAHPRPYKTTLPGTANHGIQMLMQMADKFGAATLKALVGSIGLFPIGSYVRLSSGEIGRVVDVKKENPMRPEVEVLLNSERQPPRHPRTLDLLVIPHIYVSRALTASDLRELGLLPPPSEMPQMTKLEEGLS